MRRSNFFILLLILPGIYLSAQNGYNLNGVLEPSELQLQQWAILGAPIEAAGIIKGHRSKKRDLSSLRKFPAPGSQGKTLGSCTAWTLCYALKTYQEALDYRYDIYNDKGQIEAKKIFSPSFLFNISIKDEKDCTSGIYLKNALDNLKKFGTVPVTSMPYFDNVDSCYKRPSVDVLLEAQKFRILEYYTLRDRNSLSFKQVDIEEVKNNIFNGKPVVFAIHLDDKWKENGFLDNYQDTSEYIWKDFSKKVGNHAMLCVGYDDDLGAFKALNSFGDAWVNSGYIWIDYQLFKKKVTEAYVVEDLSNYFQDLMRGVNEHKVSKKQFSISNDSIFTANGNIKENKYIEVLDYNIYFIGLGVNKEKGLFQIRLRGDEKKTIATFELPIGGNTKGFYYKDKLFKLTANQIKNIPFSKNEKVELSVQIEDSPVKSLIIKP